MSLLRHAAAVALSLALASPAAAQDWDSLSEEQTDEIIGSVSVDFYHEMGHALIDILQIPVMGAEEDAADSLSIYMISTAWEEEDALAAMNASLNTWWSMYAPEAGEEPDYWDVHSPDGKRIATMSCLFYGASPGTRGEFASTWEIPDERAESCPGEYEDMDASWAAYVDPLVDIGDGASIIFETPAAETPMSDAISEEVNFLNSVLTLPDDLTVRFADCGQANAYYDASDKSVTICTELAQQVLDRM